MQETKRLSCHHTAKSVVELKDLETVSESQKCFQFLKKAIFRGNRLRYIFTYWTTHSNMLVFLLLKFHVLDFDRDDWK